MKKNLLCTVAILSVGLFTAPAVSAAPKIAFGYLANMSNDANYDYLETIFPNSFANTLRSMFKVRVMKPEKVKDLLKRRKSKLEKSYEPYELSELTRKLRADIFINGEFTPLPGNQVKIILNLYIHGSNKIFSFTNVGRMETEIFKLVDRIAQIVIHFMGSSQVFQKGIVPKNSRIGILTNLDGLDLNLLYGTFLTGGYSLGGVHGNTLENILPESLLDRFKYFRLKDDYYDYVTDLRKLRFPFGEWSGQRHRERIDTVKRLYKIYDADYLGTNGEMLARLSASFNIDYLIIIGFNDRKNRAWVRCINPRTRELILMQSNIKGNVSGISKKIIDTMSVRIEKIDTF